MTDYNNPELYTRIEHDNGDVLFKMIEKKEPQFLQEWDESKVKWAVNAAGEVVSNTIGCAIAEVTKIGRGFRTREDAETFRDAEQMRMKMRRAAAESWGDEVIDWGNVNQFKFNIQLTGGVPAIVNWPTYNLNQLVFKTLDAAQTFIDSVGEEALIKAWRW